MRRRNLDAACGVQWLGVGCGDFLWRHRLHGRVSCRACLHSVCHAIVARPTSSWVSRIVAGLESVVHALGPVCATDVLKTLLHGWDRGEDACHAGVGEARGVRDHLAAGLADADHLDEAGAVC